MTRFFRWFDSQIVLNPTALSPEVRMDEIHDIRRTAAGTGE